MNFSEEPWKLCQLDDNTLVCLVQETGSRRAIETLVLRHHPWIKRWVRAHGISWRLSAQEIEDAEQNMVHVLIKAIACFHGRPPTQSNEQSFGSFLRWRVHHRFRDFVKRLRRVERRYDHSPEAMASLELGPDSHAGRGFGDDAMKTNPHLASSRNEILSRLRKVVGDLEESQRALLESLVSDQGLAAIARDLNIAYVTAKRRRRKLLDKVRAEMKDCI